MITYPSLQYLTFAVSSLKQRFVRETLTDFRTQVALSNPLNAAVEQFRDSLPNSIHWQLNGRFERGVAIAYRGGVARDYLSNKSHSFRVKSSNPSLPPYSVNLEFDSCDCPDHKKGNYCKHIIAAHIFDLAYPAPQPPIANQPALDEFSRPTGGVIINLVFRTLTGFEADIAASDVHDPFEIFQHRVIRALEDHVLGRAPVRVRG